MVALTLVDDLYIFQLHVYMIICLGANTYNRLWIY